MYRKVRGHEATFCSLKKLSINRYSLFGWILEILAKERLEDWLHMELSILTIVDPSSNMRIWLLITPISTRYVNEIPENLLLQYIVMILRYVKLENHAHAEPDEEQEQMTNQNFAA